MKYIYMALLSVFTFVLVNMYFLHPEKPFVEFVFAGMGVILCFVLILLPRSFTGETCQDEEVSTTSKFNLHDNRNILVISALLFFVFGYYIYFLRDRYQLLVVGDNLQGHTVYKIDKYSGEVFYSQDFGSGWIKKNNEVISEWKTPITNKSINR